jgi:hypothetical protein
MCSELYKKHTLVMINFEYLLSNGYQLSAVQRRGELQIFVSSEVNAVL